LSFEHDVGIERAKTLADEWLERRFPEARAVVAVHRDTDHLHAHVWIDARQENGKKIDLNARQYRTLDETWNTIYSRELGRDEREHLSKKQESQEYRRDRAQGVERDPPRRVDMRGAELRTVCQARDEQNAFVIRVDRAEKVAARDPRFVRIAGDLRILEKRISLEGARLSALQRWEQADCTTRAGKDLQRGAEFSAQRFADAVAKVYRKPDQARVAFESLAAQEGWSAAMREMRQHPAAFGKLHGIQFAGFGTDARVDALEALPEAIGRGGDYLAAQANAAKVEGGMLRAEKQLQQAKEQLEKINHQLERMPTKRELQQRIGQGMDRLLPERRREFAGALPEARAEVAIQALDEVQFQRWVGTRDRAAVTRDGVANHPNYTATSAEQHSSRSSPTEPALDRQNPVELQRQGAMSTPMSNPGMPADRGLQRLANDLRIYSQARVVDERYRDVLRELGTAKVEAVRVERGGRSAADNWTAVKEIQGRVDAIRAELKQYGVKELEFNISDEMKRLRERGITLAALERMPENARAGITDAQLRLAIRVQGRLGGPERQREREPDLGREI
jgi:hypothetical protein